MIATAPAAAPRETVAEHRRYRTILLFGAPGSGKGTMGKALGAIPGFIHCACGDIFRNLDLRSPLGQVFVEYSSRGLLVPDDTTVALWRESIDGMFHTRRFVPERDLLVLDGIPRNLEQARILSEHIEVERVFHLECSDLDKMAKRLRQRALKENRLDDASDEVIRRRWDVYEAESRPALDFYPPDLIERVDALHSPVEVLHDILGRLLAAKLA
uniref:Adenylate kinase n=1 Tax=uncultured Armatimonadetes bacterium TaxID=157466 RepID=A0A6J4J047_9BACT|nr:Adenylate kinase [uncultured Armatimonadetes bacterium]